jgi:hypothetical protein
MMLYKVLNETKNVFIDGKKYVVKDGKVEVDRKVDLPFLEVVKDDSDGLRKTSDKRPRGKAVSGQPNTGRDFGSDDAQGKTTKKG